MLPSGSAKVRVEAARAIARVMAGSNLDQALARADIRDLGPQQVSMLRALSYGVLREHGLLSSLLSRLLDHPLQGEEELHALLLVGLHQLRSMRVATHAAVNETVEAVALLGKARMRALVNALLRRYLRERPALEALIAPTAARHSYPEWLADEIREDWPQTWEAVLNGGNAQGPLTLRVNRRQVARDVYLRRLDAAGIAANSVPGAPDAVLLDQAMPVEKIPDFADGAVSVQDVSAQLAADLLDLRPGQRVLDACAAPGGKAAHLLERCDDLDLTALDVDGERLQRVRETLQRLHLQARVVAGNAAEPRAWWDGKPYDRILLDAPCSGTGVIRRHPDIKWLRRFSDIPRMAATQLALLNALWPLLAPGGVLLYATCSILKAEGEDVIKAFLRAQPGAKHAAIAADWGEARPVGRRIAPGGAFDGFYYARLIKP